MLASDVMTKDLITVSAGTSVADVVKIMLEKRISGVPVIENNEPVGMISESDLLRRVELGTERRRSRWLEFATSGSRLASEYVKSHARTARDVMTQPVITVDAATPLAQVADILESRHIKRVPVVQDGKLVGLVSRANLIQALASRKAARDTPSAPNDRKIRELLFEEIGKHRLAPPDANIVVEDGEVHLWGFIHSEAARKALVVAAQNTPGVKRVEDHLEYPPVYPSF